MHPGAHGFTATVAQHGDLDGVVRGAGADTEIQPALVVDLGTVDRGDDIAFAQPCADTGAIRPDLCHDQSLRPLEAEAGGHIR